jgi:hypothetical protein
MAKYEVKVVEGEKSEVREYVGVMVKEGAFFVFIHENGSREYVRESLVLEISEDTNYELNMSEEYEMEEAARRIELSNEIKRLKSN